MKQPANDICICIGPHTYIDVIWNVRGWWSVLVAGHRIGRFRTRRLGKKAGRRG